MEADLTPRETVAWAYRLLLGREPESADVVLRWAGTTGPAELRDSFVQSPEMADHRSKGMPLRIGAEPSRRLEEAAQAVLTLAAGTLPEPGEAAALLARLPSLQALRRHLFEQPALAPPRPAGEWARRHPLALPAATVMLRGEPSEPSLLPPAARFSALFDAARAALGGSEEQGGGEGVVILDGEGDIGAGSLALGLALPRFGSLRAFEPALARAAHLAANLGAQFGARAKTAATALPALDTPGLPRPGVLRLPSRDRLAEAEGLLATGCLVLVPLRLRDELAPGNAAPAALLAEWRARWGAPVALALPRPFALVDDAAVARAMAVALDDPERRLDLALGGPEGWRERLG